MTTALPPHVLHSSTSISPRDALSALDTFLSAANEHAAYRPDSTLSERGPISVDSSSSTSSGHPNLVLHHLNRIKLGLQGVRIGPAQIEAEDAVAEAQFADEREKAAGGKRKREWERERDFGSFALRTPASRRVEVMVGGEDANTIPVVHVTRGEEDADDTTVQNAEEQVGERWEDKDDYELAQDEEELDLNADRDPAGGLEQPANAQEAEEMMEVRPLPLQRSEERAVEQTAVVDKEERRRLKKLKQRQEKQQLEGEGRARMKKDKKLAGPS